MSTYHIEHLQAAYPDAHSLLEQCRGIEVRQDKTNSVLHALIKIIIGQMLSRQAAATIFDRAKPLLNEDPHLDEFTIDDLRAIGISKNKSKAILELAQKYKKNPTRFERWQNMNYAQLIKDSDDIWGVSGWSISILCLFHFGHANVFPVKDGTLQRALTILEGKDIYINPEKADPYKSYLALALWKMIDDKIIY